MPTRLVNMAQLRYRPVWRLDGTYHYPFFEDSFLSGGPISRFTANGLSGKLLANALACPPDGMIKMHNDPFITSDPNTPIVTGVDFPRVILRRAIYDPAKEALIITTDDPWEKMNFFWQTTSFYVERLDPSRTYKLMIDGRVKSTFSGVTYKKITVKLLGEHNIIVAAQ